MARLTGTVSNTTGAVSPAAVVRITNDRTRAAREVRTSETGTFSLPNLAPSTYTLTAQAPGMAQAHLRNLTLTAGQERSLTFTLQPASLTKEVTVSGGELVVLDISSARLGANVNEREVANLPLNGRMVSQLYLLAPGAVTSGGGSFDNIRFSGRANQQNAVRLDGVESSAIIDASPGNLNGESSNYPAEFGAGSGGRITVVARSGGNRLHGSLFHTHAYRPHPSSAWSTPRPIRRRSQHRNRQRLETLPPANGPFLASPKV